MPRVLPLGGSGFRVTEIAFGGIPIRRLDAAEAVRVVQHCLDRGISFIDTARGYGASEELIGKAIRGRRDQVVLASKSHAQDAAGIRAELETSLRTLGIDCIDLYQLHNVSDDAQYEHLMGPGGAFEGVVKAQEIGLVREIGITSHSLRMALKAAKSGLFTSIMVPFNFISTEAAEHLIPLCEENSVAFLAMKPMGGGVLERADLAFGYLGQFPNTIKIVGIQKTEEIDEILELAEQGFRLSPQGELEIQQMRDGLGTRFCRRCGYCMPCDQGVPITSIMTFASIWQRLSSNAMLERSGEAMQKLDNCIECRGNIRVQRHGRPTS